MGTPCEISTTRKYDLPSIVFRADFHLGLCTDIANYAVQLSGGGLCKDIARTRRAAIAPVIELEDTSKNVRPLNVDGLMYGKSGGLASLTLAEVPMPAFVILHDPNYAPVFVLVPCNIQNKGCGENRSNAFLLTGWKKSLLMRKITVKIQSDDWISPCRKADGELIGSTVRIKLEPCGA